MTITAIANSFRVFGRGIGIVGAIFWLLSSLAYVDHPNGDFSALPDFCFVRPTYFNPMAAGLTAIALLINFVLD